MRLCLLFPGTIQVCKKEEGADKGAYCKQYYPDIEQWMRHKRRIRCEEDVCLSNHNHNVRNYCTNQHQYVCQPGQLWRRKPRIQKDSASKIQCRYLKEDDPDNKHIESVSCQQSVIHFCRQAKTYIHSLEGQYDVRHPAADEKGY